MKSLLSKTGLQNLRLGLVFMIFAGNTYYFYSSISAIHKNYGTLLFSLAAFLPIFVNEFVKCSTSLILSFLLVLSTSFLTSSTSSSNDLNNSLLYNFLGMQDHKHIDVLSVERS